MKNFPTAKEMAKKTAENWSERTPDEILEKINKKCSEGELYACFFNCTMSKETRKMLKSLKYKCYFFRIDGSPGFRITW